MNRILVFAALIGVTAAVPAAAQGRSQSASRTRTPAQGRGPVQVPPGQWPSPGRCRVWIDGVPAGRQPAETDCATARRTVPRNGRVLEGASRTSGDRDDRYGDRDDRHGRNDGRDNDGWYDRNDRDDDRTTRRFIDRNGLECEEKAVTKNGRRSYDLKCREPKGGRKQQAGNWPPARAQDDDDYCADANRDGRCDSGMTRGYPTTLPDMIGAIVYGQGQRTDDVSRWLGNGRYQVRYTDANRDRRPERVRWLDGAGALLQEWTDSNRDGRADVVNVYSAGRLIQSIGGR
jgi:hypothetical protein